MVTDRNIELGDHSMSSVIDLGWNSILMTCNKMAIEILYAILYISATW